MGEMLTEMAMQRKDAIVLCNSLGQQFIKHFDKIYKEPNSQALDHWVVEMQNWYDNVTKIILKPNSKKLDRTSINDWFLTVGSEPLEYFHNDDEVGAYDEFCNHLLMNGSVRQSLKEIKIIKESIVLEDNSMEDAKDEIIKRKDELIAKRKKIVDAATKRQHGTGYWHLVSTDFTKEEQNELDEIAKELGSLLSDWTDLHEPDNKETDEDKPLKEQSNEKPKHLRDIVKRVSSIVLYNSLNNVHFLKFSPSPIEESRKPTAVKSNGVYSVLNGKWVKEPVANDIPNIDNDAFESLFKEWEDKYFNLIESNDKTKEDIIDLIEDLYDLRKSSIAEDGEYGLGNLVFKEMRSMGYLDNLREIKKEISSKELSLEGLNESFKVSDLDTLEKINAIKLPNDGTFTLDDKGNPQEVNFQSGYQASFFRPEIGNADLNAVLNAIGNKLGEVYLGRFDGGSELSYHLGNKDKAMGFAQIFNQHSIFDWQAKDIILNPNYNENWKVDYNKAIEELKKFLGN